MTERKIRDKLRKYYLRCPCFNCIVGPTCLVVHRDCKGKLTWVYAQDPCSRWDKWSDEKSHMFIISFNSQIELGVIREIFNKENK